MDGNNAKMKSWSCSMHSVHFIDFKNFTSYVYALPFTVTVRIDVSEI